MRSQEELKLVLSQLPECFEALCEMAVLYRKAGNYAGCFAMVERAIDSYEANPIPAEEAYFFELKRLHAHLLRNHLPEILGAIYQLLDLNWMPVFKSGRPSEMAWRIHALNIEHLDDALNSPQLKRVRYLHVAFESHVDQALGILSGRIPQSLKVLNLQFNVMPSELDFARFWNIYHNTEELAHIRSLKVTMPRITDADALLIRKAFCELEDLSFFSRDRQGLTAAMCEYLADDVQSNALRSLSLVGTSVGDRGLYALITSPNLCQLQTLDLSDGVLTNTAARLLTAESELPQLTSVDLSYNKIDPAGIAMLSKSNYTVKTEGQHTRLFSN